MSRRSLALLSVCGAAFLAFLDTTIVNTSFPSIRESFAGADPSELSWVLDGYFIVFAALLIPAGGVADRFGRKRVLLLANLPLGARVIVAGTRALDETRDETATGLPDLLASALTAAGLGVLALGIVEGPGWGWGSARVLGCCALAALLLAVVARRCATHPRPLVAPALAATPAGEPRDPVVLAFFSTILGNILFLTGVWGYDVLHAGLATIPGPLATMLSSQPAGRLADRFGHRAVIVPGCLVYAVGLLVLRSGGAEPDWAGTWLPGMLIQGLGVGLAFPTLGAAAAADIAEDRFGVAGAVTSAFRPFGAVLGTAILIAIVGQPAGVAAALEVSDRAYLFGVGAALGAAAVSALIVTRRAPAVAAVPAPAT